MYKNDMPFSEKVKYVRIKLQLGQAQLANEIGVSCATISRWEREEREPQMMKQGSFYAFCEKNGIKFDRYGSKRRNA